MHERREQLTLEPRPELPLGAQLAIERDVLKRVLQIAEASAYHRDYRGAMVEIVQLVLKIKEDHRWSE